MSRRLQERGLQDLRQAFRQSLRDSGVSKDRGSKSSDTLASVRVSSHVPLPPNQSFLKEVRDMGHSLAPWVSCVRLWRAAVSADGRERPVHLSQCRIDAASDVEGMESAGPGKGGSGLGLAVPTHCSTIPAHPRQAVAWQGPGHCALRLKVQPIRHWCRQVRQNGAYTKMSEKWLP